MNAIVVFTYWSFVTPRAPDTESYVLLLVCLQPIPPRPLYIYPVSIRCQKNMSFKNMYMSDWA